MVNGFVVRDDKRRHFTLKRFCSSAATTSTLHTELFVFFLLSFIFTTQSIFNLFLLALALSLTISSVPVLALTTVTMWQCGSFVRRKEIKSSSTATMSSFFFFAASVEKKKYVYFGCYQPQRFILATACAFSAFISKSEKKIVAGK